MRREWPRGQRTDRNKNQVVCEVHFALSPEELETLAQIAGHPLNDNVVVLTKNYEGDFDVKFPEPALFPNALHSIEVDAICQNLIRPKEEVGENFLTVAIECIHETTECAREGRVEQLTSIRDQHVAALQEHFTEGHPEPQHSNENQFIADYSARLAEIETSLREELTPYQTARSRVLSMLPTFVYMDDYKTFRGRADLAAIKERQDNGTVPLSEEDETFLMILELSGLDLDCLIEQGKSKDQDNHPRSPDRSAGRRHDADEHRCRSLGPKRVQSAVSGRRPGVFHRDRRDAQEHWNDPTRGTIEGLSMVFLIRYALHARQRRNLRGLRASP